MPFKRLFGRGNDDPSPPDPEESTDDVADEDVADEDVAAEEVTAEEGMDDEALAPEHSLDGDEVERDWRDRAALVIPGGTSTGSKRPAALYGPDDVDAPTHYTAAQGCTVVTASGRRLIDCTMALGSVAIGYSDDAINRAVLAAVAGGNVCGLPGIAEVEVAERLCDMIPCAEQVRFLKTGGEAVAAAIRIARVATGRATVIGCGYFGWQDGWSRGAGIPAGANADFVEVPFDDVAALERAVAAAGSGLAAIILEPVIHRLPSPEWCVVARRLCDAAGAVFILDEMKTGFRLAPGGYQEHARLDPDLAVFGKAMANGFPIAAVVGRAAVMESAAATWISTTLAGEGVGLAATAAVLDVYAEMDVCATLARVGQEMLDGVVAAVAASGMPGVQVTGIAPMWSIEFEDARRQQRFLERAAAGGVLFKRGAYNYAALAHDDEEILLALERVASTALVEVLEEEGA